MENLKEFIKINKIIIKSQQRLKSEKLNEFNKEVNNIELSANSNLNNTIIDSMEHTSIWNEQRSSM